MILCGSVVGRARKRRQQETQDLSLVIGDQVVLLGDNPHKKEQIQVVEVWRFRGKLKRGPGHGVRSSCGVEKLGGKSAARSRLQETKKNGHQTWGGVMVLAKARKCAPAVNTDSKLRSLPEERTGFWKAHAHLSSTRRFQFPSDFAFFAAREALVRPRRRFHDIHGPLRIERQPTYKPHTALLCLSRTTLALPPTES